MTNLGPSRRSTLITGGGGGIGSAIARALVVQGRGVVVALAADPDRARWKQRSVTSAQLAGEYGFTDVDGTRPDSGASL